ncbi:hypothetical protein B0H14DRAFT_2809793 [Mycena olivaceomarginata]|nr:hypothetical protein B0H14DRAFT_2809793 [Mycena olivaceomarginata]
MRSLVIFISAFVSIFPSMTVEPSSSPPTVHLSPQTSATLNDELDGRLTAHVRRLVHAADRDGALPVVRLARVW